MSSKTENENKIYHWDPKEPFQSLSPLPPPIEVLESKTILKKCIVARAALAELKQAANLIPNQGVLISILPLLEARASSEIENIVTTTDRLFQFSQSEEKADLATKEAIRYSRALLQGYKTRENHPLNTRTAEEVCGIIKGREMRVRQVDVCENRWN